MPEHTDIVLYVERLDHHLSGKVLRKVRLASPFLLQSVEPSLAEVEGRVVTGFRGKVPADRSLSRLLKGDWPRTMEELE